jgi:hypothetical protein
MDLPPLWVFMGTLVVLLVCTWGAGMLRHRLGASAAELHEGSAPVLGATLTLLGLIISFTFAMAVSRYDLRKSDEAAEANAIGTEYLRLDLLPEPQATHVKTLLRDYLAQRVLFYTIHDEYQLQQLGTSTAALQATLWKAVRSAAQTDATAVTALVVAGMNDVLNSKDYAQAAWWNRIPREAWILMAVIAAACNVLLGFVTRPLKSRVLILSTMPVVVSLAFFLIADIDSPRRGMIHIIPQNLLALSAMLH